MEENKNNTEVQNVNEAPVKKKSVFAITSLVLGIVGIALSFIPIVNNAAFVLGILAVVFGIITLVKKAGKGQAIAGLVLGILAIIITLVMQNSFSNALDETSKDLDNMTGENTEEVLEKYADVEFGTFVAEKDEIGILSTSLNVSVTNKSKEQRSFDINVEAVDENGTRIEEDYILINDLAPGQTQKVEIFNLLDEDTANSMKNATFKVFEASAY